jgi:hypothetical protein
MKTNEVIRKIIAAAMRIQMINLRPSLLTLSAPSRSAIAP